VRLRNFTIFSPFLMPPQITCRMRPWSKESVFHHLFAYELCYHSEETVVVPPQSSSTTQESEDRNVSAHELLTQGVDSLNGLASCFRDDQNLAVVVRQLRDVMRLVHERLDSKISTKDQYRLIHPFTAWFTKYSTSSFITISERDPHLLIFLLHMYAVVITLAVAFPAVDLPFFASIRLRGILKIRLTLEGELGFLCMACNAFHNYNQLMAFPLNTAHVYQSLQRRKPHLEHS
jgi:hypothetical protein